MAIELKPLWQGFAYKTHQVAGIQWMIERETQPEAGGLLCDEMGLGKTMEVLGLIQNSTKRESILLCPKAVIQQWKTAAIKSRMNVCEINGESWTVPKPFFSNRPFLYITNYEKVVSKIQLFKGRPSAWGRIVLDEAHRVKNRGGKLYRAIESLNREATWCVTATPVVNDLRDIRNLFSLLGYDNQRLLNYGYLLEVVQDALLHRSMAEMRHILPELPSAALVQKQALDFVSEDEAEFYRGVQGQIMRRWRSLPSDATHAQFALLMRLRQLSVHPQVYINARRKGPVGYERDDWNTPSTKFTTLRDMIAGEATPTRWIVFCQFHDEMEILTSFLEKNPAVWRVQSYHGGMTDKAKEEVIQATFEQAPGQDVNAHERHDVLLLQLQSGGVGLNLQHFTRVVFMSPWWTAALMDQAIGRAVRIGQREQVKVTLLLLKEEHSMNIDDAMIQKAETKRDLLSNIFRHASKGLVSNEPQEQEQEQESLPLLQREQESLPLLQREQASEDGAEDPQ